MGRRKGEGEKEEKKKSPPEEISQSQLVFVVVVAFCWFFFPPNKTDLEVLSLLTAECINTDIFLFFGRLHQDEISSKSQLTHSQMNGQNKQRELFLLILCTISISFNVSALVKCYTPCLKLLVILEVPLLSSN